MYYSATEPLYVVSHEEQARIEQRREQSKLSKQRRRANTKASAEQEQASRDKDKERKARRRAEESVKETEARLEQMGEKWAESDYASNRKDKHARTQVTESHEEMLIRKEAESSRNSPEKKQSYNSHRSNKRKVEAVQQGNERRASERVRFQEM